LEGNEVLLLKGLRGGGKKGGKGSMKVIFNLSRRRVDHGQKSSKEKKRPLTQRGEKEGRRGRRRGWGILFAEFWGRT